MFVLQLLRALNHPNIVRCMECFVHANKLCIVMELCSEGGLQLSFVATTGLGPAACS